MRIIFVRHGEPDYEKNCLTPLGRLQAAAAAERLSGEKISEIYSSPFGRALETAQFTADRLGLPVTVLEYMHEITWGGKGIPENGHPWVLSDRMTAEEGFDYAHRSWQRHPYFRGNAATGEYRRVSAAFDRFLAEKGYLHEKKHFRCICGSDRTIAVFSHGGSGGIVLSSLLELPFPYVCTVMPFDYTSLIILNFPNRPGTCVFPRLELFNDAAHIRGISSGPAFQETPDA